MKKSELRMKEVININNGKKLGYIDDVEIDIKAGQVTAVILPGDENFLLRFFSKKKDIVVSWQEIKVIGEDVVLVDYNNI